MDGVIIIDKPTDFTSFDVVAIMKKLLHTKKVGHGGTLDPMATGVLPILVGRATKAQDILPDSNKSYEATLKLGISTDTLDITGKILNTHDVECSNSDFISILDNFRGNIFQTPPMYSALKKDGVRLYDLARKGIEVERKPRPINIEKLILLDYNESENTAKISVTCSKGTYIRSLCDDIGNTLGCGAVMTSLRRTSACGFDISNSISLEYAKNLSASDDLQKYICPIENLFLVYPSIIISEPQTKRFQNGNFLSTNRIKNIDSISTSGIVRVYSNTNEFLGLAKIIDDKLKLYKLFKCIN